MLSKKQARRLKHLMSTLPPTRKEYHLINHSNYEANKKELYNELWNLADLKGWNEERLRIEWVPAYDRKYEYNKQFQLQPIKERKDNKTSINYGSGGGSNRSRIRFPRLKRKTAWKRFWKLFPHLDGCHNWEEFQAKWRAEQEKQKPKNNSHECDGN